MSKELNLSDMNWCKARIEELEREVERLNRIKSRTKQVNLVQERDALLADNARLRGEIKKFLSDNDPEGFGCACLPDHICGPCSEAKRQQPLYKALATTPEQSLARIRNQAREECVALLLEEENWLIHGSEMAALILATKEPE